MFLSLERGQKNIMASTIRSNSISQQYKNSLNNSQQTREEGNEPGPSGSKRKSSCPTDADGQMVHTGSHRSSASSSSKSYTLFLEEAKGHPIFWNGKESVSKLTWKLSPADLKFTLMTITEVLEKFTAQEYLRYCTVSVTTDNKLFSTLRMSDSFSTLFRGGKNSKGKSIHLILDTQIKPHSSRELSLKYFLIMSDASKRRVLWDGAKMVSTMVARLHESQMLITLDNILKRYMGGDYFKKDGKIELILENKVKVKPLKLDDLLGSIFQGTSASIQLSNQATDSNDNIKASDGTGENGELEAFRKRSLESFWLSGNWVEIREKVHHLLEELDILFRQRQLPSHFAQKLIEERRSVETSMRRRNRSIEEIWSRYEVLKTSVESASSSFKYRADFEPLGYPLKSTNDDGTTRESADENPGPPSESWHLIGGGRGRDLEPVDRVTSCIDGFAQSLRNCGLEIYDEDSRVSPLAGMAFTVAVVVVVCIITRCLG